MVFVTGANGLLGSHICRKLIAENFKVTALKRKNSDLSLLQDISHKIEWVEGDIMDQFLLEKQLSGAEAVIHCAAIVSFNKKDAGLMHKINVEGTGNVVNLCLKLNIPRLIHISSIAAIGRSKRVAQIDENTKWESSEFNTNYALTKYKAELNVWRGICEGLNAVIVNPSIVLGPGDWERSSARIFKYVWEAKSFYPSGSMNFVDVRDVANIVSQLMKSEIRGERFILNGGNISYRSAFAKIAAHFNKKQPFIKANKALLAIAYLADQIKSTVTGKPAVLNKETIRLSSMNFNYNNNKILNILNYKYKSAEDTIAWTSSEYLKKYASNGFKSK